MAQDTASPGTRERILEVALQLFTDQGYDRTSLRQVAEEVGVTKAALYYHFPSKESLFQALMEQVHQVGHHGLDLLPPAEGYQSPGHLARQALIAIDTVLSQRRVFLLMQRNQAVIQSLRTEEESHQQVHEEMGKRWAAFMGNEQLPLRQRVRLAAGVGAVMVTAVATIAELGPEPPPGFREELAGAVFDVLEIPEKDRPPLT